ncbi:hypothetical protein MASR2M78_18840 [Treponema sp.]
MAGKACVTGGAMHEAFGEGKGYGRHDKHGCHVFYEGGNKAGHDKDGNNGEG